MVETTNGAIEPVVSRPDLPKDYLGPAADATLLPWEHARQRLSEALNYWVCTVRPNGRPHTVPVWGVWMDGRFYCDGSPETRRNRNIAANPAVVVHLENGSDVVIVEGEAYELKAAPLALRERLSEGYSTKYGAQGHEPGPETWAEGGLYEVTPRRVLAWTEFPTNLTRWQFK